MSVRIGFTGDVMLGRSVDEHQWSRPDTAVWGDVLDRLLELDGLFINLECCLSKGGEPWQRTSRVFHFRANPEWAIPALEAGSVDCCALANNHVLDFEERALLDTIDALDEAGIAHAGAGQSEEKAFTPAIVTAGPLEIGFVSITDNAPAYAATETDPGTAYVRIDVDTEETRRRLREAIRATRERGVDLVVASLHWGPNMVESPPTSFQRFAHWLVDEGVDIVHGHSAHLFQGIEVRDGRPIFYDTGDFIDDYAVDERLHNDRSFLFEVTVTDTGVPTSVRLIPTEIADYSVALASSAAAEWSRTRMRELSSAFGTSFERKGSDLVLALDS